MSCLGIFLSESLLKVSGTGSIEFGSEVDGKLACMTVQEIGSGLRLCGNGG
jgi:hypothetical protein